MFTEIFIILSMYSIGSSAPQQECQIKTKSWCILASSLSVDLKTGPNSKRVWTLYGSYLKDKKISIFENTACHQLSDNNQSRSEALASSIINGDGIYSIRWSLNKSSTCDVIIEIPALRGRKDEVAYEAITLLLKSCLDDICSGPNLLSAKAVL